MKKLIVVMLFLAACAPQIPIETGPPIEVLFCEREDCVGALTGLLGEAQDAKCAIYRASIPEVVAALQEVDWITEDDKAPLMHNKFCVIDASIVWTGSWNPTKTSKGNNVVIVPSKVLARNYLDEFEELPGGYRRVIHPVISYNNQLIENYFCPEDDCKENVLEELQAAERRIVFLLSWITDEDIVRELERDDIVVEGIIDKAEQKALPWATPGSVHHKVFVIDDRTVITGSYNPTKSGDERNDENILIIHDPAVAREFLDEYEYLRTAT